MKKTLKKVLGDNQRKFLKKYNKKLIKVNKLEVSYKDNSLEELREKLTEIKSKIDLNKKIKSDLYLPEVFAIVRETARQVLGQRHFDVQLIGGMALHDGKVAEMKTGEGKTLVATAPVTLNALAGNGVHVVTVNDYLAQRDAGWMGQVYDALGLSVGVIIPDASFIYDSSYESENHDDPRLKHLKPCSRKEAYRADITYGTNNEYGFDYLRDNMVRDVDQLRQRDLFFAIVDEVDSILIDEARTPLIISAPSSSSSDDYVKFARIARTLDKEKHFVVDEKRKTAVLTDLGMEYIEGVLGVKNLYEQVHIRLLYHVDQALKAEALFKRDKDYVVANDGEVVIVDEFTGRLLRGRRYNEGLHQAIEAKENVKVQEESMTLATISFQNYFRLYKKLSGMTGTAMTESEEFHQIYKLDVIEIPSNRKVARIDKADRIYRTEMGKFKAIIKEVQKLQTKGQPVLIGTVSIEKNEILSRMLSEAGVEHSVLNAKNNEKEAAIVAKAGEIGSVTLATNIAGRGTDIVLSEESKKLGGLFVVGSERHESRRIDNQLRGRSGRQGDPGETQFFVSTEDDLMRIFGGDRINVVMQRLKINDEIPIENRVISKSLESAQKKVEGFNFDARKSVVDYDDVMNRHRKSVYSVRSKILHSANMNSQYYAHIKSQLKKMLEDPKSLSKDFEKKLQEVFSYSNDQLDELFGLPAHKFYDRAVQLANENYKTKEEVFGEDLMRKVERDIYLRALDELWMQHLENMDHLREGIHWISVGQKDPLVEYRKQGQYIFESMQEKLQTETLSMVYRAEPVDAEALRLDEFTETDLTRAAKSSVDNADAILEVEDHTEEEFKAVTKIEQDNIASKKHNQIKTKRKKERKAKSKARKNKR